MTIILSCVGALLVIAFESNHSCFVRPPFRNCCFTYHGSLGNTFNGYGIKAILKQ